MTAANRPLPQDPADPGAVDPEEDDAVEPDVLGANQTLTYERASRRSRRRQRSVAAIHTPELDDEVTFVYEPNARAIPGLRTYARSLWECRAFAVELARSKVKGAHANTMLGGLWAILDPMFMVGIYYFIFSVLREGQRPSWFIPALISGILHWQVSASSLSQGSQSVSQGKNLMLNSTFPRMLLPLSSILSGLFSFAPAIPVIFASLVLLDISLTPHLAWWVVLFAVQVLITIGLTLLFATAIVFVSDIKNTVSYITRIMFFTSPIIFPTSLIPAHIVDVIRWTPYFGVFGNYQRIIAGQTVDATYLLTSLSWGVVTLILGAWLFLRYEREFTSRLS